MQSTFRAWGGLLLGIITVLFPQVVCSQGIGLILPETFQLNIERQNNFTYSTRIGLNRSWTTPKYEGALQLYHDNLLNTAQQTQPFVQALIQMRLWQYFWMHPKWSLASWIETDQFLNSQNQRYSVYAGARLRPIPGLEITPLVGYSWDYRQQILDQGISPALRVQSVQQLSEGLEMRTRLFARTKYIRPRHQRNISFLNAWTREFGPNTAINFTVAAGSNQMDDYKSASIERIKSDTLAASLQLEYPLLPGLLWQSYNTASFTRRGLDYEILGEANPEFNDLTFGQTDIYLRQVLSFKRKKWDGNFSYEFQSLGREYELENSIALPEPSYLRLVEQEARKDFFRRYSSFDLNLNYRPGARHMYTLTGTNRYLMYDTPSEENFDDHDELTYSMGLNWQARWTSRFSTSYRLIGRVRRYAFLFGERSQDNYTQRNLRLDASLEWAITPNLSLSAAQYVYVTYNVKDFEDRNLTDRSTRNLETRIKVLHRPKKRIDMEWSLYRRETHLSYLNWDQFTETPLDTNTLYLFEQKTYFQMGKGKNRWRLQAGYKHFSQLRFLNTSMVSLTNILTPINLHINTHQTGPVTGVYFYRRKGGSIEASIWWQTQVQGFRFWEIDRFTTLSSNYQESQLLETKVVIRPFFRLRMDLQIGV